MHKLDLSLVLTPAFRKGMPDGRPYPLPSYATDQAAAFDVCAVLPERLQIPAGGRVLIGTGLTWAHQDGVAPLLLSRSGMSGKRLLLMPHGIGLLDPNYRGEIMVQFFNAGFGPTYVDPGERIAQVLIVPFVRVNFNFPDTLPMTARGAGGFGSTDQGV